MTKRYTYLDPIFLSNTLTQDLWIGKRENPLLLIYRIITGTSDCRDELDGRKYNFRTDYVKLKYQPAPKFNKNAILENFPEEVDLNLVNNFFAQSYSNKKFYTSILNELTSCLISKEKENFLEAFIYIYRLLEGICYTIPLLFVSKSSDYKKSYKQLQTFFANKQDGELAFFKRFISNVFKDEDFFKLTIDINFSSIMVDELREEYYKIHFSKIKPSAIIDSTENEEIKVSFIGFYEFMIEVRNRFFHFLQGSWQENLSSSEVLFPNQFFQPIIEHGVNWISIILFELIKFDFSRFEE